MFMAEAQKSSEVAEKLKGITDLIQAGIVIIDPSTHRILDVNDEAARLVGLPKEKIVGQICHKFICPAEVGKCPITDLGQTVDNAERCLISADNMNIPILKTVTTKVIDGKPVLIESFLDISPMKKLQKELEQYATIDVLTQTYNRRYFLEQAEKDLNRAKRTQCPFTLVMFDIDNFKHVNDTYGHAAGDAVLKHITALCKKQIRPYDALGRIGGEEFAIAIFSCDTKQAIVRMEQLREMIEDNPMVIDGKQINVTISIGIATLKDETEDVTLLLKRADQAMYKAKNSGRNKVQLDQ
jgi:diguanylate cyclase (GGDEF)-like protein